MHGGPSISDLADSPTEPPETGLVTFGGVGGLTGVPGPVAVVDGGGVSGSETVAICRATRAAIQSCCSGVKESATSSCVFWAIFVFLFATSA